MLYLVSLEAPLATVFVKIKCLLLVVQQRSLIYGDRKAGMDGVGVRAAIAYRALSGNMKLYCMTSRGRLNRYANSSRAWALTS